MISQIKMNPIKTTIEIVAPGTPQSIPAKHTALLICNACHGKGHHTDQVSPKTFTVQTCLVCLGTGYVKATIEITFKSSKL